jgi:hypothetical protein
MLWALGACGVGLKIGCPAFLLLEISNAKTEKLGTLRLTTNTAYDL